MSEISVRWPFYRYSVLMPEHIPTDIFVWLYLSLFVHINQQAGKNKDNYAPEEKAQVKRFVKEKFSKIIDEITLEKIIHYAERDYVIRDMTGFHDESIKTLSEKAFEFIESFNDIFSPNMQIKFVYQDAITGSVVPVFEDMPYLRDCNEDNIIRLTKIVVKQPSQTRIKAAYRDYLRINKNYGNESVIEDEPSFEDPDAEVDFDPFDEEPNDFEISKNNRVMDNDNFNAIILERTLFNYKVNIIIENGQIVIETPLDRDKTASWMQKRFQEASNICPELIEIMKENQVPHQNDEEINSLKNNIIYQKDVAEQLDVCGKIYRLVETVSVSESSNQEIQTIKNNLKIILIRMDKYFIGKSDSFFSQIGQFLECLISPLIDYSDKGKRQNTPFVFFKTQIRTICLKSHIKWDFLMRGDDLYREWQKARNHFKADLLNVVIANIKFMQCGSLYYELIEDAFSLYNLRNRYGHYKQNRSQIDNDFQIEYVDTLYKVTRILLDLYP